MSEATLFILYMTVSLVSAVASAYSVETALKEQDEGKGGWSFILTAILLILAAIYWLAMAVINIPLS